LSYPSSNAVDRLYLAVRCLYRPHRQMATAIDNTAAGDRSYLGGATSMRPLLHGHLLRALYDPVDMWDLGLDRVIDRRRICGLR